MIVTTQGSAEQVKPSRFGGTVFSITVGSRPRPLPKSVKNPVLTPHQPKVNQIQGQFSSGVGAGFISPPVGPLGQWAARLRVAKQGNSGIPDPSPLSRAPGDRGQPYGCPASPQTLT